MVFRGINSVSLKWFSTLVGTKNGHKAQQTRFASSTVDIYEANPCPGANATLICSEKSNRLGDLERPWFSSEPIAVNEVDRLACRAAQQMVRGHFHTLRIRTRLRFSIAPALQRSTGESPFTSKKLMSLRSHMETPKAFVDALRAPNGHLL